VTERMTNGPFFFSCWCLCSCLFPAVSHVRREKRTAHQHGFRARVRVRVQWFRTCETDRTHVTFLLQSEGGERTRRKNTSGGVRSFSTTEFELFKVNCTSPRGPYLNTNMNTKKRKKNTNARSCVHAVRMVLFSKKRAIFEG